MYILYIIMIYFYWNEPSYSINTLLRWFAQTHSLVILSFVSLKMPNSPLLIPVLDLVTDCWYVCGGLHIIQKLFAENIVQATSSLLWSFLHWFLFHIIQRLLDVLVNLFCNSHKIMIGKTLERVSLIIKSKYPGKLSSVNIWWPVTN